MMTSLSLAKHFFLEFFRNICSNVYSHLDLEKGRERRKKSRGKMNRGMGEEGERKGKVCPLVCYSSQSQEFTEKNSDLTEENAKLFIARQHTAADARY